MLDIGFVEDFVVERLAACRIKDLLLYARMDD
jgi:hypothetical protein